MKRTCLLLDMERNTEYAYLCEVGKLEKTLRGETLVLPQGWLRSPGTQGNTRILIYRDTSKLLIMNMQFILAALVYRSSAESSRALGDIPFGQAKSHIRRWRIPNTARHSQVPPWLCSYFSYRSNTHYSVFDWLVDRFVRFYKKKKPEI